MPFKKTAVVFPGQGSQYVGMLLDYFDAESSFRNTFSKASEILKINLFSMFWYKVLPAAFETLDPEGRKLEISTPTPHLLLNNWASC